MSAPANTSATYADIEALPSHVVGEILFGTLVTHPRPHPRHGIAAASLTDEIVGFFQKGRGGPGGWIFIAEQEIRLGPHVTVPDISGWRRERLPAASDDRAFIDIAPGWICEIISASTEKYDKGDKRRIYALYGVPHLWHLDPRAKTLELFTRADKNWLLTNTFVDVEDVYAPPFDDMPFSLGLLWPLDPPASSSLSDEQT